MKNTSNTFQVKAIRENTNLYFIIFHCSFYNLLICIFHLKSKCFYVKSY